MLVDKNKNLLEDVDKLVEACDSQTLNIDKVKEFRQVVIEKKAEDFETLSNIQNENGMDKSILKFN